MKNILLLASFILAISLNAQRPEQGGRPGGGGAILSLKIGKLYGRIYDESSREAIGYASVVLLQMRGDSVISGCLTKENGDFRLDNLAAGPFRLKISFIGYAEIIQQVRITPQSWEQDLGNFYLKPEGTQLAETTVTGEKQRMEMTIDRKVYHIGKDIMAQGGTAIDALKNVPTITVDMDGNAKMRNASPHIFVDGKPTTLSLEQIPANEIDRIEVITNPGARFDAGSTTGILNIVLRKNEKPGINGMARLGAGTNERVNGMANINIKEFPFGVSASYSYNGGKNYMYGFSGRDILNNGQTVSSFYQDNDDTNKRAHQNGRVGFDYQINNRNAMTASVMFGGGDFNNRTNQTFTNYDGARVTTAFGDRVGPSLNRWRHLTGQMEYKRTYPTPNKEWVTFVNYNKSYGKNNADYTTTTKDAAGVEVPQSPFKLQSNGGNDGFGFQFQSDFTKPWSGEGKLEAGVRASFNHKYNYLTAQIFNNETKVWQISDYLGTDYETDESINAAYLTLSDKLPKNWKYQAGLRGEYTNFQGGQTNSDSTFSYNYPSGGSDIFKAMFPSLFLTKTLSESREFQINFSRKIGRPNHWHLMPNIWVIDNQNYRTGNPNIKPEFFNTLEMNYSHIFKTGNWLISLYGRQTNDPITNVTIPASDGTTALISTVRNGKVEYRSGLENTLRKTIVKGFDATANLNIFYQKINVPLGTQVLENEGFNFNYKLNLEYKFLKHYTIQSTNQYESTEIRAQGKQLPQYFMDIAIRRDFGPMANISFQISDVFNSRQRIDVTEAPTFYQESRRRRDSRYFMLNFQYLFGKPDFSIVKRRKQGGQEMQGGGDMF